MPDFLTINGEAVSVDDAAARLKCRVVLVEITERQNNPWTHETSETVTYARLPLTVFESLRYTDHRTSYRAVSTEIGCPLP